MSEIRILLDACVGWTAKLRLEEVGADVRHVLDVAPTMKDPEVIALARPRTACL